MKRRHFFFSIFFLFFFLFSINSYASEVGIENLSVDKTKTRSLGVKGLVRNLENHPIKGYVKIKFLNNQGDIIKSALTYVNDGDPLNPGQAGVFEYWCYKKDAIGVVNFKVIFKDK